MEFATKPIQHYPPHLRHVATLPWEIKNSNFLPHHVYGSTVDIESVTAEIRRGKKNEDRSNYRAKI